MKKVLLILFYSLLALSLSHCATTAPETQSTLPKSPSSYAHPVKPSNGSYNDIDMIELSRELQMDQRLTNIGFQEKSFDTCRVRANKSKNPHCKRLYLGRVHYKIMCRDSSGTVQKVNLEPMNQKTIRWKQGVHKGMTRTNSNGFGYIQFVTPSSSKNKHLYLYLGRKVARKSMADLWKLVFPKNWCY